MATAPQLRKASLIRNGLQRVGTKESGFRVVKPDGSPVTDEKTLERVRKLRIPPAWREVRIARGAGAPLLAIGLDAKGRTQYLYHPSFRKRRDDEKYLRIVRFGELLPRLRRRVRKDLSPTTPERERVLAAIVRLIDQGFFRVGNEKSAKSESTFGLTTVRSEHVRVNGDMVTFDYVGKWRKSHKRAIRDAQISRLVADLKRSALGDGLFRWSEKGRTFDVKDHHVNRYIQDVIGEEFTAKDFRTWAGTLICSMALAWQGQAEKKTERKRRMRKAVETTASLLGNTPAVSRASYICPRLLTDYEEGLEFDAMRKKGHPIPKSGLSVEEKALLRFLRETIADRRAKRRPSSARYDMER
ncbi:MAG TPA: DNA topoisomerase IB [Thermoanaerobaculia bacterium]|nr:DNA topoisomerase IB [Thermoanaerobaculia bacterium]